jgi:outer membrane protein OmpA-like peptidoglycan-associated protein
MSSCYNYGPTHIPYGNGSRPPLPPPPPPVKQAPPRELSKKEYMYKTYSDIKESLSEADVDLINDSIKVLFPDNIVYKTGDLLPSSDYMPSLDKFSLLLKKYMKTNILIAGHTDNKGKEAKNKALSQLRADNIKTILISKDIAESRLESWGIGSLSPLYDNNTEEGRTKNRRVEFVVLYDEN